MLRVGYQTYAGNRYQGLNQDRLLSHHVKKLNKTSKEANNIWLWGVFDGHNCLGELAAAACCDSFQKTFNNMIEADRKFDNKGIEGLFERAHKCVLELYTKPPLKYTMGGNNYVLKTNKQGEKIYSINNQERLIDFGTTATVAIFDESTGQLIIANCGDSEVHLLSQEEGSEDLVLERLTTNHNAADKSEVQRIAKSFNAKFTADGYLAPQNTSHQSYQINITRSIGHQLLFQYGVTYLPSITWHTVDSATHKALIMASDGLWNNLTKDQILETVISISDPQKACDALIASVKELEQYSSDIDNTSVLLVYFGNEI